MATTNTEAEKQGHYTGGVTASSPPPQASQVAAPHSTGLHLSPSPPQYAQLQHPQSPQPQYQQPQYQRGPYQQAQSPQPQYQQNPYQQPHSPQPVYQHQYVQSPPQQQQQHPQGQYFPQAPAQQFVPQPMPLAALTSAPSLVRCPRCGNTASTAITSRIGNTNHAWAAIVCFFTLCGCIPYLIDSFRDVEHRCSSCGAHLATWHRSGRTVVHAF